MIGEGMNPAGALGLAGAVLCAAALASCAPRVEADEQAAAGPHVAAADEIAAGEYLMTVAGCNDCHTPMWPETNGGVPAEDRLVGVPIGFRGPWGTSYPANLRLSASARTADEWVEFIRTRQDAGLPPMPWMNLRSMSDEDLRAMHAYLVSLGAKGETMPAAVPPVATPTTLVYEFVPVTPAAVAPTPGQ